MMISVKNTFSGMFLFKYYSNTFKKVRVFEKHVLNTFFLSINNFNSDTSFYIVLHLLILNISKSLFKGFVNQV